MWDQVRLEAMLQALRRESNRSTPPSASRGSREEPRKGSRKGWQDGENRLWELSEESISEEVDKRRVDKRRVDKRVELSEALSNDVDNGNEELKRSLAGGFPL